MIKKGIIVKKNFEKLIYSIGSGVIVGIILFYIQQNYSSQSQVDILKVKEELVLEIEKNQAAIITDLNNKHKVYLASQKNHTQSVKQELKPVEQKWSRILDISWVKDKLFGFDHRIDVAENASFDPEKVPFYVSVEALDKSKALVIIKDKDSYVFNEEIQKGSAGEFRYPEDTKENKYKISIINIRKAGWGSSLAMYFAIDIKKNITK